MIGNIRGSHVKDLQVTTGFGRTRTGIPGTSSLGVFSLTDVSFLITIVLLFDRVTLVKAVPERIIATVFIISIKLIVHATRLLELHVPVLVELLHR